jgi:predicted phage-related endonuclease
MVTNTTHVPIEGPLEGDPAWLAGRFYEEGKQLVIGASDAAAACNRSDYRTSLDLFLRARRIMEVSHTEEQETRMRRGRRMQSVIINEYMTELNVSCVENNRMYFHPQHAFMAATPDAIVLGDPRKLLEVKATTARMYSTDDDSKYGQEGTDSVPDDVLFQAQQQMAVMGVNEVDVAAMFGIFTLRVYTVVRNDDLIEAITEAERELVERIANNDPPEPNWTHPRTKELLSIVNGMIANTVVQLDENDLGWWLRYKVLGDEIGHLEMERGELRNRLMHKMGSCELGRFPRGEKELRRLIVKESVYTEADVEEVRSKLGNVKRKAYERLLERKVK